MLLGIFTSVTPLLTIKTFLGSSWQISKVYVDGSVYNCHVYLSRGMGLSFLKLCCIGHFFISVISQRSSVPRYMDLHMSYGPCVFPFPSSLAYISMYDYLETVKIELEY